MTACLTLETFVQVVQHSFKPTPTMTLLKKIMDFHGWLEGVFSKHYSCISLPRQLIFSKSDNDGGTVDVVKAMVRCSEWSNSVLGEAMFPLQRLPNQKPRWNANRPVFSKWKTPKIRTFPEKSEEIFKKAESQIFSKNGKIMIFLLIFKGMRGSSYLKGSASGNNSKRKTSTGGGLCLMPMLHSLVTRETLERAFNCLNGTQLNTVRHGTHWSFLLITVRRLATSCTYSSSTVPFPP